MSVLVKEPWILQWIQGSTLPSTADSTTPNSIASGEDVFSSRFLQIVNVEEGEKDKPFISVTDGEYSMDALITEEATANFREEFDIEYYDIIGSVIAVKEGCFSYDSKDSKVKMVVKLFQYMGGESSNCLFIRYPNINGSEYVMEYGRRMRELLDLFEGGVEEEGRKVLEKVVGERREEDQTSPHTVRQLQHT